jgi:hypothetical protein
MLISKHLQETIKNYICSFFEIQFFISLVSLPLLIAWGIPISIMSPLANFIFTPLMILFLWMSCITTICIITHIPSTFFETILQQLTYLWLYLLSFSKPSWLVGFPISSIWLSALITLIIITWYIFIRPNQKITVLFLAFCWSFMIIMQPLFTQKMKLKKIGDLPLWTLNIASKTYLIDHGALCNRKNMYTNLDFTILPNLIYHTGFTTVDTIIFCKPSNRITKIAQQCAQQFNCKNFIVTPRAQCYEKMKKYFENSNIRITRLNNTKKKSKTS